MNVEECNLDWFKGSLVARVHEVGNIQNIKELFVVEGYQSIKLRHLGDNLIILTSMDKADLKECLRGSEEWLSEIFESIDNWSEETTMEFRLTWA